MEKLVHYREFEGGEVYVGQVVNREHQSVLARLWGGTVPLAKLTEERLPLIRRCEELWKSFGIQLELKRLSLIMNTQNTICLVAKTIYRMFQRRKVLLCTYVLISLKPISASVA